MINFLIDKQKTYSYEKLLNDVNDARSYFVAFRTNDLYDYFLNVIVALVNNKPLILIDSDMSNSELNDLEEAEINSVLSVGAMNLVCTNDLIRCIQNSLSEITIFTSGTTGQPKKVVHKMNSLTRNVKKHERFSEHVWAFAYNPTHMAGLQVFFQSIFNFNTLVNVFSSARSSIFDLIENYSITHISATPTFYRLLLPVEKTFDTVQSVTFGGEKSEVKLYNAIIQIFPRAKVVNIYASTEAGSLFSAKGEDFQIPENIMNKIKIKDGELLIHKSLLGRSESFEFFDNYYCTGDLIEWINKEDRIFRFVSRKNELVNVGGYKVNPIEVENSILLINGVSQVLVYGRSNSVLGNVLCADVKIDKINNISEFDIRSFLSKQLQDFKIPRRIKFVDNITLTRTGKIKRK